MSKKSLILLLISICFYSCQKNKVILIKQWHLSPSENTLDIEKSKANPKYQNQVDIYQRSLNLINEGSEAIIAEGCEKVDTYLKSSFNGWNFQSLLSTKSINKLDGILAPAPLKLKVKLGDKIELICGDSEKLIKEHLETFSDLRGYINFFSRLLQYQETDWKAFEKYEKALGNIVDIKPSDDSVLIAKNLALKSLKRFTELVEARNAYFLKMILENLDKNPILIIGGLHIKGIAEELESKNINFEIVTPSGYPEEEDLLISNLYKLLNSYGESKLSYYQTPRSFLVNKFDTKNLIPIDQIATKKRWKQLEKIASKNKFDIKLLRSDYDGDGVRDFTLSQSKNHTIISAEDSDWDNDGIENLIDNTLGESKIGSIEKNTLDISNSYSLLDTKSKELVKTLNSYGIDILNTSKAKHDQLILKVFISLYKYLDYPKENLKFLIATEPIFSYGKKSFFSYNKQSKSLEIYSNKLLEYLAAKKKKSYQGTNITTYVNGVVIPVLVHSLAHEIGHARDINIDSIAKNSGWSWDEKKVSVKYLSTNRHPSKKIDKAISNVKFKGVSYNEYLEEHNNYLKYINKLISKSLTDSEFREQIRKSKFYTKLNLKEREYLSSFTSFYEVPSIYSLSSPSEWYAESFAACIFNKFYPKSISLKEAIRYELLIGFRPIVDKALCQ